MSLLQIGRVIRMTSCRNCVFCSPVSGCDFPTAPKSIQSTNSVAANIDDDTIHELCQLRKGDYVFGILHEKKEK